MALRTAMQAMMVAGMAAQALSAAGDVAEAVEADNAAMSAALGMSASMTAAQMASDAVAIAMGAAMGKDLCVPPGTPGVVMFGSPTVLIGGFPMPPWMAVANGLLRLVRGLRARAARNRANSDVGFPTCPI